MYLRNFGFKDLYVQVGPDTSEGTESRYHKKSVMGQDTFGNYEVPHEYHSDIHRLRELLVKPKKKSFSVDFDGFRMRCVRYSTVNGQIWCCLRRISDVRPNLFKLNMPEGLPEMMVNWGRRDGLVIIGGSTGSGKTTTSIAMIEAWLSHFGGTLYAMEDPVEYLMQGRVGQGFAYQREVEEDYEWAEFIKDGLRSAPNYIFVGEVRDAKAARQLLRAATSGHCTLCTVHGSSIAESISAIAQNAREELGDMAYNLLAEGLTAVIYQTIKKGRPIIEVVETKEDGGSGDQVRQYIRAQKLSMLGTEISRQKAERDLLRQGNSEKSSRPNVPKPTSVESVGGRPSVARGPVKSPHKSAPKPVRKKIFGLF